jgi:hypothetical protein
VLLCYYQVFSDPRFALDPTDPQFRKTPGLSKLLDEGSNRRAVGKRGRDEHDADGKEAGRGGGSRSGGGGHALGGEGEGDEGGRKKESKGGGALSSNSGAGGGVGGGGGGKKSKFQDAELASLVSTLKARAR